MLTAPLVHIVLSKQRHECRTKGVVFGGDSMETKTCTKCGTTKPIEQYYKSPGYRGGHHTWCIECVKKFYKERYKEHREEITARNNAYKKAHPEVTARIAKKNRDAYPEKRKARWQVHLAVLDGRLPRHDTLACKVCGGRAVLYHHWSYLPEHWLDVIPLCDRCHKHVHLGEIVHPDVPVPNKT
jgi:hypothetical protein